MVKLDIFKVPVATIRRLFGDNAPKFEGHIQPIAATRRTYFFVRDPSSQAPPINQQIANMGGHMMDIDGNNYTVKGIKMPAAAQQQDIEMAVIEMKDTFNMSDLQSAIHSLQGGSKKSISKRHQRSHSRSQVRSRSRRALSRARSKTRSRK